MKKIPLINRDISWLSFNERVLQEAEDSTVPLMDRIKFLGIFSNNRDEFFRVRVATINRMLKVGKKAKKVFGEHPSELLNEIHKIVLRQQDKFESVYNNLIRQLEAQDIFIINEKQLHSEQEQFIRDYFRESVHPTLFPIILEKNLKFPYLKNNFLYLICRLTKRNKDTSKFSLIEIPTDVLPRFITLPKIEEKKFVIFLDDVIRFSVSEIFAPFDYIVSEAYTIKITRDAELDIEPDVSKSFIEKIAKSVKKRKTGMPVRLTHDSEMPVDMVNFLLAKMNMLKDDTLIPGNRYHNFRDFISFPFIGTAALRYKSQQPLAHKDLKTATSIISVLKKKDIMLSYPYQRFSHIIDLLREASIDPKVESIRITLYRVAEHSNIINALINAIKNGKSVSAVVELQARFDEEANIQWATKLQEEGVNVIFGVPGLKLHSKLFLITRREDGKRVNYAHIGTGNFNENTAKIYSDISLLTSDKRITNEIEKTFDFYSDNLRPYRHKHLVASPFSMRKIFSSLIKNEISNARKGKSAYIILKLNSLSDADMIKKLYKASQAGVKIKLLIRGICSLVPGKKKMSENIEVISIIDKYLEHSRVFIFCNKGKEKYFISSADWMTRNLDYRSEIAVPIYDDEIRAELSQIIAIQLNDNVKARILNRKQENIYKSGDTTVKVRAQEEIYRFLKQRHL